MDNQSDPGVKKRASESRMSTHWPFLSTSISLHGVEGILGLFQTNAIDTAIEFDGFQFVAR